VARDKRRPSLSHRKQAAQRVAVVVHEAQPQPATLRAPRHHVELAAILLQRGDAPDPRATRRDERRRHILVAVLQDRAHAFDGHVLAEVATLVGGEACGKRRAHAMYPSSPRLML
jgi:hypothetical protein